MRILIFFTLISCCYICAGQPEGSFRKYLDDDFEFTTQKKATYSAMAMKSGDHWMMLAVYPDTGTLLKAYFRDKSLRIKDGPFTLYYEKNIKAYEGQYVNNVQQGVWKYYYRNGQLKDSGLIKNNQMVNTWRSWHENGQQASLGSYQDSDPVGEHYTYHWNGNVEQIIIYPDKPEKVHVNKDDPKSTRVYRKLYQANFDEDGEVVHAMSFDENNKQLFHCHFGEIIEPARYIAPEPFRIR